MSYCLQDSFPHFLPHILDSARGTEFAYLDSRFHVLSVLYCIVLFNWACGFYAKQNQAIRRYERIHL